MKALAFVLAASACGGPAAAPDAFVPIDGDGTDAHTICDPTAPFGAPVAIAELNTSSADGVARFSPTETTVYFETNRGGSYDIYSAHRASRSDPFDTPAPLANVNSPTARDNVPTVSENGNLLVFGSDRVANEGVHLYSMQRNSTAESFTNLQPLTGVSSSTVADSDAFPFLSADLQQLWFASTRSGGSGDFDLYRANAVPGGFANPVEIAELESTSYDSTPVLSSDELTVYFASLRPGGPGGTEIWTAHRASTVDAFPTPTLVTELDTPANEYPAWLSLDNCRLYLTSDVLGNLDIYVATR